MEELLQQLNERIANRLYGKYRGFVADNEDPLGKGRLKLKIPSVLGSDAVSDWALPCLPFGGTTDTGMFFVPDVDAQLWVEFEEGDVHRPIWVGVFWQTQDDVPEEAQVTPPTTRIIKTPGGHRLQFDDEEGEEQIILHHTTEAELVVDKNGSVTVKDAADNQLELDAEGSKITVEDANGNSLVMSSSGITVEDANGNKIEMSASAINVEGSSTINIKGNMVNLGGAGGEPVIKGQSFLTLFSTHIHSTSGYGAPTSPPVPQGEASTLSSKVMTT